MRQVVTSAFLLGFVAGYGLTTAERTQRVAFFLPPGAFLKVDHRYGPVVITGAADDSVVVDARITVSSRFADQVRSADDQIAITAQSVCETLKLTTSYPETATRDSTLMCAVELDIRAPRHSSLSVSNIFGDIRVRGMGAFCLVEARYGDIDISDCVGAELFGHHGTITAGSVRGSLTVDNDFGDVSLCDVNGLVRIRNRYGSVGTKSVCGSVRIDNLLGDVECHQDSGTLSVSNRMGGVRAWLTNEQLETVSLMSCLGPIELFVRSDVGCRLAGCLRRGAVVSGIPIRLKETGGWRYFAAVERIGGPDVELVAREGDVAIIMVDLHESPSQPRR